MKVQRAKWLFLWGAIAFQIMPVLAQSNVVEQGQLVRPLFLLVEEGVISPPVRLPDMKLDGTINLTFTILSGHARFQDEKGGLVHTVTITASPGAAVLPPISPGPLYDESVILVTIDQEPIMGNLRVATLPQGAITELSVAVSKIKGALVEAGDHHAVVDESLVQEGHTVMVTEPEKGQQSEAELSGVCVRVPWGPGWVNWGMSNPAGYGYSVLPENSGSLVWASAPGQAADGIYNRWWGCGIALKIADSCTATVSADGSISCCCNWSMTWFGKVCRWVNPGTIGWPNCPL